MARRALPNQSTFRLQQDAVALFDLKQIAFEYSKNGSSKLARGGKIFEKFIKSYLELNRNVYLLTKANEKLARLAQEAMLQAYAQRVVAERSAPAGYRKNERYSGGLEYALNNRLIALGSARAISVGDKKLLDQTARHWRRLNYGTAPAGSLPPVVAQLRWGSGQGFTLRSADEPPRPGFTIPATPGFRGYFKADGSFYMGKPTRKLSTYIIIERPRPTRGIKGRRFIDEGVRAVGQNFKPVYEEFFQDAERRAASKVPKKQIV